jgi:hypothetical protein
MVSTRARQRKVTVLLAALVLVLLREASCFLGLSETLRRTRILYSHPDEDPIVAGVLSRSAFLASLIAIPVVAHAAYSNHEQQLSMTTQRPTTASTIIDGEDSLIALPPTPQAATIDDQRATQHQITVSTAREESIASFVAGAALTVTKTLAKYPLDTATVRLQMPGTTFSVRKPAELLQGCYVGLAIPLITNIPGGAVFYSVKDAVKSSLLDAGLSEWSRTCLGVAAAQLPYWIVRNPSEVVRTRQQVGLPGYTENVSTIDAYKRVREVRIRETNATGLTAGLDAYYSGYLENVYYSYPADVMKFVFYEKLTQGRYSRVEEALAGAAATAISQFLTTPLDVVRNRVMAEKADDTKTTYVGLLAQIAREEGLKGLFAGATPNVLKALISGAIQFATYEETKQEIKLLLRKT